MVMTLFIKLTLKCYTFIPNLFILFYLLSLFKDDIVLLCYVFREAFIQVE